MRDPLVRWLAWSAMLIGSSVPEIICRQFIPTPPLWLPAAQAVLLLTGAAIFAGSPRLRKLCGFLLALAALVIGWSLLAPAISSSRIFHDWTQNLSWGARFFLSRLLPVSGALLMLVTLIGSGLTRRDLFLCRGDLNAWAQPEPVPFFFRPIRWSRLGGVLLIIFGVALPLILLATLPMDFTRAGLIWRFLPWGVATAALNAANEEFQYRSVMLARLRRLVGDREAMLVTAFLFGLGHFHGQPSGPVGAVTAGFAGWIWAKSMIETRGFLWAFSIHMVQDIVIFAFLVISFAS